jgi:hypothetical protein
MSASGHEGGVEREASIERLAECGPLPAGHNGGDDRAEKADYDLGLEERDPVPPRALPTFL